MMRGASVNERNSGFEFGVEGDHRAAEELGDGASGLGVGGGGVEGFGGGAGDLGYEVEMDLGDGEAGVGLLQRDRRSGADALGGEVGGAELSAERHAEASGVRGGEQLFRVGAYAVLKARAEAVLRVLERAALGADAAFTVFESTVPNCAAFAIHDVLLMRGVGEGLPSCLMVTGERWIRE